jgi:hypothetical protein
MVTVGLQFAILPFACNVNKVARTFDGVGMNVRATNPRFQSISIDHAVLCVDCEMISNTSQEECGVCGSRSLLNIANALGGSLGSQPRAILVDMDAPDLTSLLRALVNSAARKRDYRPNGRAGDPRRAEAFGD